MPVVYLHIDQKTKEVVYVGRGTLDRPWQVRNRSQKHMEWLVEKGDDLYSVVSIVFMGTKDKTKDKEIELIEFHRPKFNLNYDYPLVSLTKEEYDKATDLRKSGYSYSSIAKFIGKSTMTIFRALTGKTKAYDKYK